MLDEFKEIEGYDGKYLISNTGIIISKSTTDKNGRNRPAVALQQKFITGYVKVGLIKNKIQTFIPVADLVLKHFSDEWKEGCIDNVMFLDNNAFNCKYDNLKISEFPISLHQRSIIEIRARKLIKEAKAEGERKVNYPTVKQPLIKLEKIKKKPIIKNRVAVSLHGSFDDKAELIKKFSSFSDAYEIEIVNDSNVNFKKKTFKIINRNIVRNPTKISSIKPPPPPLGFCTIPGYKGKYLINKEGKITSVKYNKLKKKWIYKELKYTDNGTSLMVTLSINGDSSIMRVAAVMLLIFARVKNSHCLRIHYKDENYKNVSFDNLIFE